MIKLFNEKHTKGKKSELAWGKTSGQRWLYFSSSKRTPLRRFLSWLCEGTPLSNRKENWEILVADGSGTPQEWDKIGQQNLKSSITGKYINTYKARTGEWKV